MMQLAYEFHGTGPVVVLLHGYPLDRRFWKNQVAFLKSQFRVLTIDLRGFGESRLQPMDASDEDAASVAQSYSMASLADDCARLLDELQLTQPVVLGGLSMGGYVAFEFWNRHRNKLRGLILCDTRASSDSSEAALARRKLGERALIEGTTAVVSPMLERLLSAATMRHQPMLVDELRAMMVAVAPATIYAAQHAMAARSDFTSNLNAIHVPCLALVGSDDGISPPDEMKLLASKIPRSEFVIIPDSGHLPPIENPDAVNQAFAQFLGRLDMDESN